MTFVDGGGLLTKSDLKLGTVDDLADKRVAIIPGTTTATTLEKFLKEGFSSAKYVSVKNHVDSWRWWKKVLLTRSLPIAASWWTCGHIERP
jgi:ABC-type amino acid transport substrate-binding protein